MSSSDPALVERVKAFHRTFPTGVTVVTTNVNGVPHGLAVNAFASASLDPPSALVCINKSTRTHEHLSRAKYLAVNVLANYQLDLVESFSTPTGRRFDGLPWHPAQYGSPIIEGYAAALELEINERLEIHTHTIFLGRIADARVSGAPPLLYFGSQLYDGDSLTKGTAAMPIPVPTPDIYPLEEPS